LLHDESFITGFLIGQKQRGTDTRDTIEFGDGVNVDIWKIPSYDNTPVDGSFEVNTTNCKIWAFRRIGYVCDILQKKYGMDVYISLGNDGTVNTDLPKVSSNIVYIVRPQLDGTRTACGIYCVTGFGTTVNFYNEPAWLVMTGGMFAIVSRIAGTNLAYIAGGFYQGVSTKDGTAKYVTIKSENKIYNQVTGLDSYEEDGVECVYNEYYTKQYGGTYKYDSLWSFQYPSYWKKDGKRVNGNFSAVGTCAKLSGRSLMFLCNGTAYTGSDNNQYSSARFLVLSPGVQTPNWRGLLPREYCTVDYNEDETDDTQGNYYDGYNKGYSAGYEAGKNADSGYTEGYEEGYSAGKTDGDTEGYERGYAAGYGDGYSKGYNAGISAGGGSDDHIGPPPTGCSLLYITLTGHRLTVLVNVEEEASGCCKINWGDGSGEELGTATGAVNFSHTYAAPGDYVITITANSGTVTLGRSTVIRQLIAPSNQGNGTGSIYNNMLRKLSIGDDFAIGSGMCRYCYALEEVFVSDNITEIPSYAFSYCQKLTYIRLNDNITTFESNAFSYCPALDIGTMPAGLKSIGTYSMAETGKTSLTLPEGLETIGGSALRENPPLCSLTIPSTCTSIGDYALCYNNYQLSEIHCRATTPPTLTSYSLNGIKSDCVIYVPAGTLAAYQAATYWKAQASIMQEE
jgi:hypothetical protein